MEKVIETHWSKTGVLVCVLWGVTVTLTIAGWVADLASDSASHMGRMLVVTAGVTACMAAVAHVRLYMLRLSALIRATHEVRHEVEHLRALR